jgi:hypothetical protein
VRSFYLDRITDECYVFLVSQRRRCLIDVVFWVVCAEKKIIKNAGQSLCMKVAKRSYNPTQLISRFACPNLRESKCSKEQNRTKYLYTIKYSLYYITRLLKFTDVSVYGGAVENLCTVSLGVI